MSSLSQLSEVNTTLLSDYPRPLLSIASSSDILQSWRRGGASRAEWVGGKVTCDLLDVVVVPAHEDLYEPVYNDYSLSLGALLHVD